VKTPTDETLLAEHLAGRHDAFELLVRRYSQELYRFVLRFTNNSIAAEDIVQDAFLQAHLSAGLFDPDRRFKSWLFTIAANKARDWLRSRNRRAEVPLDAAMDGGSDSEQTFRELFATTDDAADDNLEIEERRRAVRGIVETMSPLLREVLVLAYYHRFAYRDIADILGIPVGTVKSRLHAAVGHFGQAYRLIANKAERRQ